MRIEHQVQIASSSTCFVILRRYKQSWQNLEHDKKLGNAFNNNLDHGDYENHGTWWVYSFIVLVVPSEQRANKTFRLLKANVFMQLVYGAYNVVHIRTQSESM